ncbi:unnamed protein product (macronuclear) [Paramecium tetraurelia]|uniref:Uncharacterized protein n=1 Tax=Paramecium tetraurelia TaxID=5888 RepID=A0BVK2_PARTE|nr:uncharacterized protein GSPATT00005815001 [Paramecium tetraurelia]CAK62569.1 unnamed protein product [Paramecium tetraurelia]|eukprot:XP_001429967.1 hypothetical protein (macronuclear) [Paramecium tetraurelia strain d4-2]
MSITQFSIEPPLHTPLFYNIDIIDRFQDLPQFEPIHLFSQQNQFCKFQKERKIPPTINLDNNSLMFYQIQVQKTRVKKPRQQRSCKYRRLPDFDCNSCLKIIQPSSMSVKNTPRIQTKPQRLPSKCVCHISMCNESQTKEQKKISIRLPIIERSKDNSPTINCWTRNTSTSFFQGSY